MTIRKSVTPAAEAGHWLHGPDEVQVPVVVLHRAQIPDHAELGRVTPPVGHGTAHPLDAALDVRSIVAPRDPARSRSKRAGRSTREFTVPLVQIGTPPDCVGLGIW